MGDQSLTHESYMRALLGKDGGNQYPGFSDERLDGFQHLSYDLSHFCGDFLSGDGDEFKRCVVKDQEMSKNKGLKSLSS